MIAVLLTIYSAVVLVLFKLKLLKPRPYPIALCVLAGIFIIGGIVVTWMQYAPISSDLLTSQYVVQLVPYVQGQVKTVYAQANQPMKKGDLLLEIDPTQYQYTVNQFEAQLKASKAALVMAVAADDLAKTQEQIALNIQRENVAAISKLKVIEARQQREEADAAAQQAAATVGQVEAQLGNAQFNLAQCKMLAPTDGYVVNWQVQPGTMLVPSPTAPAGTFVSTEDIYVLAVFPQNYLTNVEPGDDAELVLDPYPGRLFTAKVDSVIPASGGGQLTNSGTIPNAAKVSSSGVYAVKIRFTDEAVARKLSLGSGGDAAIYTKLGRPVHIISKITIRMKKWLLYVIPSVRS